jgi:hypothetical protein
MWLIRPDGYVAAVAMNGDIATLENVLGRFAR